jgi:tetratricopeptide (TPR) repeat protein
MIGGIPALALRLTMRSTDRREAFHEAFLAAFLVGLSLIGASAANAQSPFQQRPAYQQAPNYRSGSGQQPTQNNVTTRPTQAPQPTQSAPASMAAQPAPTEPQRRPQALGSGAASAQAAATCMNEQKSASADSAIKSCDAVIDETLKNLANAYYFRASAKFGKNDFDGAIGDYGQALRLDPADADYLNSRAAAYEAKNDFD